MQPVDRLRRRVYATTMEKSKTKRDNAYWADRLKKDGHRELLDQIAAGEITMFKARQVAGYLTKSPASPAEKLNYQWNRASHNERKRFLAMNLLTIDRLIKEVSADLTSHKAKKLATRTENYPTDADV